MANHQDASQSVDIKYAGIQTPHPLKGAQHMLKRDTLDTRTRPGSSVPHPGIGMPSQQHHPGRMSRLCQTGLLVQPSWTHINPTCYQLERKGTQAVDTGPMKTCAASRLARSVSGPRAASGGKSHPRHADKISPTQEPIRRNGKGVGWPNNLQRTEVGVSAERPPGGDRQRLLGKGGVATETSLEVPVSNPRPMERSILHAVITFMPRLHRYPRC